MNFVLAQNDWLVIFTKFTFNIPTVHDKKNCANVNFTASRTVVPNPFYEPKYRDTKEFHLILIKTNSENKKSGEEQKDK